MSINPQYLRVDSNQNFYDEEQEVVRKRPLAPDEIDFNDCSANWVLHLSTDHLTPKVYTGDTHAAYGVFTYKANRRNRYVFRIEGKTPDARFFSYETYQGPLMSIGNSLMDFELVNMNPGLPAHTSEQKSYQFIAHPPEDGNRMSANQPGYAKLALTRSTIRKTIKTIMMRIYAPRDQKQLSLEDVPKVFAFDPVTGEPKRCPPRHDFTPFEIPQKVVTILRGLKKTRILEFGSSPKWFSRLGLGANTAVKDYVINTTRIDSPEDVSVIKFRAPHSADAYSAGQVRYWSFCFQNFARNQTLDCLPDYLAKKDQGEIITVVHGKKDPNIEKAAKEAGYYFIPDVRNKNSSDNDIQRVVGFVYRNMMTTSIFDDVAYTGDYKPQGRVCTKIEFLDPYLRDQKCL